MGAVTGYRQAPPWGCDMTELADLESIVADMLEDVSRPTEQARGLPGLAFHDPAFLDLENRRLFPRCWVAAGAASDRPR